MQMVCLQEDFDASTQTCASPYWVPQEPALQGLTLEQGQEIAVAIALLWAVAWGIRVIRKTIE